MFRLLAPCRHALLACLFPVLLLTACGVAPIQDENSPNTPADSVQRPLPPPSRPWQALQSEASASFAGSDVVTEQDRGGGLRLRLPADQLFGPPAADDSSPPQLKGLAPQLQRFAGFLKQHDELDARIVGYTDSHGRELLNQARSLAQADALAQALIGHGVPFPRLHTEGRGEAEPIADDLTEQGRASNRRLEILLQTRASSGRR